MKAQLEAIEKKAFEELTAAQDLKDLDAVRVKYLGKKGELTAILKQMGKLSAEERPVIGQLANQVRAQIEERLEETKTNLEAHILISALQPRHWMLPCRANAAFWAKNIQSPSFSMS